MAINIQADFTCDNSYAIWLGNQNQVQTLIRQETNILAEHIYNGEHFSFTAYENDYLYVLAWSDDSVMQGLMGTFNGGITKQMGDTDWKVLATGQNKNNSEFPSISEINLHLANVTPNDWKQPFVGPSNANTSSIYANWPSIPNIDLNANWVWYDSNNSGNPFNPGKNHQEFLIFRVPVKNLISCCSPCVQDKFQQEKLFTEKAKSKFFTVKAKNNAKRCKEPYSGETCSIVDLSEIQPCFYLHWGDSKTDQIESHDDEVMYLTVCNPYKNIRFNGFKVSKITISPLANTLANGEKDVTLVPDALLCFDTINGCTCTSRPLTLLVRDAKPQDYTIEVEYCIDSIELTQFNTGKTSFVINVINS